MERSVSRGRDGLQSTGRGGLGNIRATSPFSDRPSDGPDDFSSTRGREPKVAHTDVYSTGRGGAGNIHSPSRDANGSVGTDARELDIVREYERQASTEVHSTGRGGVGNISRSRSRGPATAVASPRRLHSSGRGGVGNIKEGNDLEASLLDEEERRQLAARDGQAHSTGRGGLANITDSANPGVEQPTHHPREFEASGRGGAGNIRDRTHSRGPDQRSSSQDKERHGISGLLHKVTHPRESS